MNGVLLSHNITHGALYTHDPIKLPYGPPWPLICDQKWAKTVEKHVFGNIYLRNPITLFHWPINGFQLFHDITHGTPYTHEPK
jgi:hypothetical protein